MPHWARHGSRIPPDAQPHVRADRPAASLAGALAASPLGGRSSGTLGLIVTLNPYSPPSAPVDEEIVTVPLRPISYLSLAFAGVAWLLPLIGWLWGTTQAPESTLYRGSSSIPVGVFLAFILSVVGVVCAIASLNFASPRQPSTSSWFAPLVSRFLACAFVAGVATTVVGFLLGWWP